MNIRSVTSVECSQLHEELKEILRQRELPINNIAASPPVANVPNIMAQQPSQGTAPSGDDGSSATPTTACIRTPPGTTTTTGTIRAADVRTTNNDEGSSPTALIFHETECFYADPTVLEQDTNGPVVLRLWSIRDHCTGTLLEEDCDEGTFMS